MPLQLIKPAEKITSGKTLFIGGKNADALPDEMIPLVARNQLRIAVDFGCDAITIIRKRWRHTFSVADLLREAGPVSNRRMLGPSLLQVTLAGSQHDTVNLP